MMRSVRQQRPQPRQSSLARYQLRNGYLRSLHSSAPIRKEEFAATTAIDMVLGNILAEAKLAL